MHLKGNHVDRIRMTSKAEGNVLHTYAFFQKGYIYQIFMCNYTVSKAYLSIKISPIYVGAMVLVGAV